MLRLGAVGAAADGAGAGRRSEQRQSVPRSLRGRTTVVTAMVTRLTAMVMGQGTPTRLTAMAMAPGTITRLMATAPGIATRLMAMAMAGALSAVVSMPLLGVVGAKADQSHRRCCCSDFRVSGRVAHDEVSWP